MSPVMVKIPGPLRIILIALVTIFSMVVITFMAFVILIAVVPLHNVMETQRSAKQGDAESQRHLAYGYESGALANYSWGLVRQDRGKAIYWYQKAAAQGDAKSTGSLGRMYEQDGNMASLTLAMNWYLKAGKLGDCSATRRLAEIYSDGLLWQPVDKGKALFWKQKAESFCHVP